MTVAVMVNGHDINISKKLREYIEKKVGKLDHYLPEINEARVDLSAQRTARDADDRQVAQITVRSRGTILRSEERTGDMFAAVDLALEKMQRQIERYKDKHRRGRGDGADLGEAVMQAEAELDEAASDSEPAPKIVRRKRFPITPMTEPEAIEQMMLLQHDNFFIFYNADTARINILYARKDGSLGLIEPEVG
ncbi:MAG: ribosome-associated translation inhibitor RaiA [Chloroflexi bacterium]|nr:ribosome-associated translation inhibitor RaiA [Chloroflexota bacterium]